MSFAPRRTSRTGSLAHATTNRGVGGCPAPCRFCKGRANESVPIWQPRFYDFNVWAERKQVEKLDYIHNNPVKRGLVAEPEEWRWSSYRSYMLGEPGLVRINDCDIMKMTVSNAVA